MAYYQLEPFGETRADIRSAIIASTIANIYAPKGKSFGVDTFMPTFDDEPKPEQSIDTMLALVESLNTAFGGKDLRQK